MAAVAPRPERPSAVLAAPAKVRRRCGWMPSRSQGGDDAVGEVRRQRQFGRPADQQAALLRRGRRCPGASGPVCSGSARSTRKVAHCVVLRSIHGSNWAISFCAVAICSAGSRCTPSLSAMSPPMYQTHWPSAAGCVVTVMRGLVPPPRQWAYSGFRPGPLAMIMCSGRRCMAGWLRPRCFEQLRRCRRRR